MSQYARDTSVSTDASLAEIKKTVQRYGATGFMFAESDTHAMVMFDAQRRRVKFIVPLPSRKDQMFWKTPGRGLQRTQEQAYREWEQACRQRWRALALAIKAKLEAVESGIATFEQEFMAHIVLPDGRTVGEVMSPQIEVAYETGTMPPMLPEYN